MMSALAKAMGTMKWSRYTPIRTPGQGTLALAFPFPLPGHGTPALALLPGYLALQPLAPIPHQ
jgi:hypothetical protein